jgi:hypothetical protein
MKVEDLFADAPFVTQIQRALRAYGSNRFPALRGHIDDLTNQSLSDLWRYLKRSPDVVSNLAHDASGSYSGAAWESVARIASTIMARRAADMFRRSAMTWSEQPPESSEAASHSDLQNNDPTSARLVLIQQMLRVCMAELARSSERDREAVWLALGDGRAARIALTDTERQRVSRLRKRLGAAIRREMGESASELLAADLREG